MTGYPYPLWVGTLWRSPTGSRYRVVQIESNQKLALLNEHTSVLEAFNLDASQLTRTLEQRQFRQVG